MEEEKKDKSFVIKDRRIFSEAGREEPAGTDQPAASTEREARSPRDESQEAKREAPSPKDESQEAESQILPEVNFLNFILSLSTTVMFHFGDFPDPITREVKKNIPAAKQTIDILSLLKDKTKGNLDDQEKTLLEEILYELKMRYVKETSRP